MGTSTPVFEAETEGVIVRVTPTFLPQKSDPDDRQYLWMYAVEVENRSSRPVRLLTRYWRISETSGLTREIAGDGVVGAQPVIQPGQVHRYASTAPLGSPSGLMGGHYGMVELESGRRFDVTIPTFALDSPFERSRAN